MEKVDSFKLKTLDIHITDQSNIFLLKSNIEMAQSSKEDEYCHLSESGLHNFVLNFNKGESVCQFCGIVSDDRYFSLKSKPKYQNQDCVEDHEKMANHFQRKYSYDNYFKEKVNSSHLKRVISRDGYYSPVERKDAVVSKNLKEISAIFNFPPIVIENAFKHFKKINKLNTFKSMNPMFYCATLIQMSAIESGYPILMNAIVNKVKKLEPKLKIKEINKVKNKIMKSGYQMRNHAITIDKYIESIFRFLRADPNINQKQLLLIECESNLILNKTKDILRFKGNSVSYTPSIIWYVIQRDYPNLTDLATISKYSYLSTSTIELKYKFINEILKKKEKKIN